MLHIYGHTWPARWGSKNEAKKVKVYSVSSDGLPTAFLTLRSETP